MVAKALFEDPSGALIAKKEIKVIFPVKYEESKLAHIADKVTALGVVAFVVDNFYAVNNSLARMRFSPSEIEKETFNDETYYVLKFDAGSVIVENTNLVKEETLGYYIYNYFIALGRVPWYLSALDVIKLFETSGYYTGKTYGVNHAILEMINSMIIRDGLDNMVYWRQTLTSPEEMYTKSPEYVPLRNVPLGARNTTAKLMGAYFDEGLNSALLNDAETTELVEEILRQ